MNQEFIIIECKNPECHFRFPAKAFQMREIKCPRCKSEAEIIRKYSEVSSPNLHVINQEKPRISIMLDNIRSVYNVGSILRTADGFGIKHIYLCGITATPDNDKIAKTGLGAEWSIPWTYGKNCVSLIKTLKQQEIFLLGLEVGEKSIPIHEYHPNETRSNILLVLGNEIAGIDPEIRDLCDQLVYIPMYGYKQSYNVTIAFGIAVFYLTLI